MAPKPLAYLLWLAAFALPFVILPLAYQIILGFISAFGPIAPKGFPDCVFDVVGPDYLYFHGPGIECQATQEWQEYVKSDAYREFAREMANKRQTVEFSASAWLANGGQHLSAWGFLALVLSFVVLAIKASKYWLLLHPLLNPVLFMLLLAEYAYLYLSWSFYIFGY